MIITLESSSMWIFYFFIYFFFSLLSDEHKGSDRKGAAILRQVKSQKRKPYTTKHRRRHNSSGISMRCCLLFLYSLSHDVSIIKKLSPYESHYSRDPVNEWSLAHLFFLFLIIRNLLTLILQSTCCMWKCLYVNFKIEIISIVNSMSEHNVALNK